MLLKLIASLIDLGLPAVQARYTQVLQCDERIVSYRL